MRLAYRSSLALIVCLLGTVALPFVPLDTGDFHWQLFAQAYAECESDATTLCLNDARFQVRADWETLQGAMGEGQSGELTDDTGYFWFFDSANVEIVIKVLDACAINDSYWVFAGGLTDVMIDLTVFDTETGALRQYQNPVGTAFRPIQDTSAFRTCP
jgi:hypothetical protein